MEHRGFMRDFIDIVGQVVDTMSHTAARRWYEQSVRTDPSSVDALSGLVGVDLVSNRPNDALARVRAELAKNPKRTPVILLLAKTYGVPLYTVQAWVGTARKRGLLPPSGAVRRAG